MNTRYSVVPVDGGFAVRATFGSTLLVERIETDRYVAEALRVRASIEGPAAIGDVDPDAYVSIANQQTELDAIADAVASRFGNGHVTYADGAAEAEGDAQAISANTRTLYSIDGLGAQTETRWRGSLPANAWASSTHNLDVIGRSFDWLIEFNVKKTSVSTDALLLVTQDIGSDPLDTNSIIIFGRSTLLTKAQDVAHRISIGWSGYGKETFLANGAKFYLECDADIAVWGKEVFIRCGGVPATA